MKKTASIIIICVCLVPMFFFGVFSLLDKDAVRSDEENRMLARKPEFSATAFFSGDYMRELSKYYADTFPFRETLMRANKSMNAFYFFQGGNDGALILEHTGVDGGTGETVLNIGSVNEEPPAVRPSPGTGAQVPASPEPQISSGDKPSPEPDSPPAGQPSEPVPEPAPPTPAVFPDKNDARQAGSVVVFGTRAMEIVYAKPEAMSIFANTVSDLAASMPEGVKTLLMVVPNSGEFYSSEEMHTGSASQKAIIESVYGQLDSSVISIDAYSHISKRTDEYIYFRTDHHWTALGAYYAYTAFCERMGLEAVPLSDFETGVYEDFVGSMYTFTAKYPVSQVLLDNPDTLTYYFPRLDTEMTIYTDGPAMNNGFKYPVVNTKLGDYSNKYICFIGGDNELTHIKTSAGNGKSIMVVKESFANAFVPFLTSHYEDIWVIDPRKLNGKNQPSFNMAGFTAEHGIDEVLYLNYPFMAVSKSYSGYLERLK